MSLSGPPVKHGQTINKLVLQKKTRQHRPFRAFFFLLNCLKTFLKTRLTVHRQSHVPLCHSDSGHDGLAGVRSSVLLRHSFQLQGVAVAEHLEGSREEGQRGMQSVMKREPWRTSGEPQAHCRGGTKVAVRIRDAAQFEFNFNVRSFNHGIRRL